MNSIPDTKYDNLWISLYENRLHFIDECRHVNYKSNARFSVQIEAIRISDREKKAIMANLF